MAVNRPVDLVDARFMGLIIVKGEGQAATIVLEDMTLGGGCP